FTWTYDSTSNKYVNYIELGDLAAGATTTETVTGWGYYYLGMQGVMFSAEYTSDYGQGIYPSENFWGERDHRVGSNALAVLIHPSLEKQGEAEPSFPEPKLAITSTNSTETAVDWNTGLTYTARTITTTVTNEGDGPAIIDYIMQFINHNDFDFQFNATHADMIISTSSGDDLSQNWFAFTNDVMGISVAGLECFKEWNGEEWVKASWTPQPLIELEPGETLTLTLRLRIQENGVDFPPVLIQASSKYPLYGGETGPIEDDNDAGTRMRSALTRFKRIPSPGTSRSNIRATRQGAEEAGTDPGYGAFGAGTGVTADSATPTLGTPVVSHETPTTGMIFNLQVSITDQDSGVSSVQIEIDTVRSDMLQLVTDLEIWKYTFLPFSEPTTVTYKIIASDVVGNEIESESRDIVVIQGEPTSISDTSEKPSEDGGFIAGFELGVIILVTSTGALIRRRYRKHK
ncbi:MAG: hypothetical protein ACFFCQ_07310, partial [Promethearchaeota archaeon]